jgi:NRAMP (natural resistance-associated macrophage protein)-like metal ion transporter
MPHNLYLHSHISKFRSLVDRSPSSPEQRCSDSLTSNPRFIDTIDRDGIIATPDETTHLIPSKLFTKMDMDLIWTSIVYSNIDSILALSIAFCVNCAILVVAGSLFYGDSVADLFDAHRLIKEVLGPFAAFLFAIALLLTGQSSTITGKYHFLKN